MKDKINPDHYKAWWIEAIDYLKAKLWKDWFEWYLVWNIIKYTSRYKMKNWREDILKAEWYIKKLLESLK